jgi:hypothetical protein
MAFEVKAKTITTVYIVLKNVRTLVFNMKIIDITYLEVFPETPANLTQN